MNERKPVLSVRISQELVDRVDRLVQRTGVGRAEIVERCLEVGLIDEEKFVEWLEAPVRGEFVHAATHPLLVNFLCKVLGNALGVEVDPTQMEIRKNLTEKRRGAGRNDAVTT